MKLSEQEEKNELLKIPGFSAIEEKKESETEFSTYNFINSLLENNAEHNMYYYMKKLKMDVKNYYNHELIIIEMKKDVYKELTKQISSPTMFNINSVMPHYYTLNDRIKQYKDLIDNTKV